MIKLPLPGGAAQLSSHIPHAATIFLNHKPHIKNSAAKYCPLHIFLDYIFLPHLQELHKRQEWLSLGNGQGDIYIAGHQNKLSRWLQQIDVPS